LSVSTFVEWDEMRAISALRRAVNDSVVAAAALVEAELVPVAGVLALELPVVVLEPLVVVGVLVVPAEPVAPVELVVPGALVVPAAAVVLGAVGVVVVAGTVGVWPRSAASMLPSSARRVAS
jgi:hypothetical protein